MGRPEPCVLFAQTFVHPILDEYVDEVLFADPVVVTACEFLEQSASSASPVITLVGGTSPPSFALEVFVQCGGEPRFRRLAQPFLYSHSSSNVLEVEAVVTNHLVVRGSYRSLTLVVYGNTAEDLGQFNIEFDLDNSLANLVSSPSEGKLEDLPPALHSTKLMLEEYISPLKSLSLPVADPDLSFEMRQFLQLIIRTFATPGCSDAMDKVASTVVSAVSSYVTCDSGFTTITWNHCKQGNSIGCKKEFKSIFTEAKSELQELYKTLQSESRSTSVDELGEAASLDYEAEVVSTTIEFLPDVFSWYYLFIKECRTDEFPSLSKNQSMILGLSLALLLCSGREPCFHFVSGGGMEQVTHVFHDKTHKSTAVMLMLLAVVERATRYAIGCEGLFGWWPREDENVPVGSSEGYSQIVKLLLQKQRHDVSSLATYVLHRLHTYEAASRFESAVLSLLGGLSSAGAVKNISLDMLASAKLQLKKLLKLFNSRGPIEDPAPVAHASRSLLLGQTEGPLSYKASIDLIAASKCSFSIWDIDPHVLSLLKERGFLPLSAALLSSTIFRSEGGHMMNLFADIASLMEAILLSLLLCRSGLVFLLLQPEATVALIHSLEGVEYLNKEECVPLRYASVLISKGFLCRPQDVGIVIEQHLRVVCAIDRVLASTPHSEELLWILWELCGLSRSDSGRQALLTLGHFPEAVLVLMEALRSAKEVEPTNSNSGTSPLNLAIFHSAAELFEVIVTDATASSLGSWIEHAVELHNALHSSSPGSNRKDVPTRLLEWVDAGVVYQKNGAIGLLRYAAVLASGGDGILVSDSMDVDNVVGDYANGADIQVMENLLGKLVSDKSFDGLSLRDSCIAQLTTTFRILAFISENSSVAAALYEEGAVTLIYSVLVNCKFMLERSSNTYDYLVDEGAECNSTTDLLLERGREQSLVDLMIPCLVLLITLLHKLQEANEQHRNTKLLNALLRLHREVSPKLAACVADLSSPYPGSALSLGAVCHLLVSAVACWPVFGWTPGLFHCLIDEATSPLALGPKEACSLLALLGDLFPDEGIWLWKNGMPSFSALRTLAIGTLLGPPKERQVDWYLQSEHVATLLIRLTTKLDDIAKIILHFSFTALVVVQDMLRVLIVRIACQSSDNAAVLLRPVIVWLHDHISESFPLSDTDVFKVYRLLDFIASLLEHPSAKILLLKEGGVGILIKALEKCSYASISEGRAMTESKILLESDASMLTWCLPVFKSVALICDSHTSLHHSRVYDKIETLSANNCSSILYHLLKLWQVLPVGKELLASLVAFKGLASRIEGRHAFTSLFKHIQSPSFDEFLERGNEHDGHDGIHDDSNRRKHPPLLCCWRNLSKSIDKKDDLSSYAIEAVGALSLGALCFCMEGKSLNLEGISVIKCLFGLPFDLDGREHYPEEKLEDVNDLIGMLDLIAVDDEYLVTWNMKTTLLQQIKERVKYLLLLLQKPTPSIKVDDIIADEVLSLISSDALDHSKEFPPQLMFPSVTMTSIVNDNAGSAFSQTQKSDGNAEKTEDFFSLGGLADKFMWDCPDSLSDRIPGHPVKKKTTSMEAPGRRSRGEVSGSETTGPNTFARGMGPLSAPSGPTRRDTFRQRKPNTSRPPSMHVDDYQARLDGLNSGSNVVGSGQRGGSTGGRPPSIHVDEFVRKERERQLTMAGIVGEATPQARNAPPDNDMGPEKVDRSRQLKADLDDDLQEINIVFDGEESESDERVPFPQPDDNIQPAPVIVEGSSPRSIVEETESDANGSTQVSNLGTPSASNGDENTQSELSSKRSVSRPDPLSREASVTSEKKFPGTSMERQIFNERSDDSKPVVSVTVSNVYESGATANATGFPPFFKGSATSVYSVGDSRMPPPTFYRESPQQIPNFPIVSASQGPHDQKHVSSQPPLPPFPPPPNVSRVTSQSSEFVQSHSSSYGHSIRDIQPPLPPGNPLQSFDVSGPMKTTYNGRDDRSTFHNAAGLYPPSTSSSFVEPLNEAFSVQLQTEYLSAFNMSSTAQLATPYPTMDSMYTWAPASSSRLHDEINHSIGGSTRPPPLPPTPPPFSASAIAQASMKSSLSHSSGYNQSGVGISSGNFSGTTGNLTSYSPPQLVPLLPNTRPLFSSPPQQHGQIQPSLPQTVSTSQPSGQSMQSRLQPPPPQPPHSQFRQPNQVSVPEGSLLQSPIQLQVPTFQMHQQPNISPGQVYYSYQQQDSMQQQQVENAQPQYLPQQTENALQQHQQQDSGLSLQHYFSSPEAIQSLLNDREKLCQLLEQHPKLMQMLQDKLSNLTSN